MTDKDRLIEVISKVQYLGGLEEKVADYLLANGVIVPPCKVGDKVYIIGTFTGQLITNQVVAIVYGESGLFLMLESFTVVLVEKQLGKTVFLTKEEAEAKLKELGKDEHKY